MLWINRMRSTKLKEIFKINSILPSQHWKTRYMILKLANLLIQFRKKVQVERQKRPEKRNGPKGVKQFLEQKKKIFHLLRSEEHTSELQSPYVISYAVF